MRTAFALPLLLAFAACKQDPAEVTPMVTDPVATPPKPATPPDTPPPQPAATKSSVVVSRSSLQKTPSKEAKIDDPSGKKVSNWITLLQRGEHVDVLKTEGEWSQVKASDGQEGWVDAKAILSGENLIEATVLAETQAFDRPDLIAVSAQKIPAGSLLFIVERKDKFSQVNVRGTKTLWVISDKLSGEEDEVQVSRMIERARYLVENKKDGATQLVEVAKTQFAETKLLPILQGIVDPSFAAAAGKPEEAKPEEAKPEEAKPEEAKPEAALPEGPRAPKEPLPTEVKAQEVK